MEPQNKIYLGIDIGGTHISAGVVDIEKKVITHPDIYVKKIDSKQSSFNILNQWSEFMNELKADMDPELLSGIGIAMPGPFDYTAGYSKIRGIDKFENLFGQDLQQFFSLFFEESGKPVVFVNDAVCFALGEYYAGAAQNSERTIVTTLGTGFGSTFLIDGKAQTGGENIPADGFLYHCPVGNSIADDYFSTRWFRKRWQEETGEEVEGVRCLAVKARSGDPVAQSVFSEFATNLSVFMKEWIEAFRPDKWVIGGNIAKASDLFLDILRENIPAFCSVEIAVLEEEAPFIGAAMSSYLKDKELKEQERRKTTQFLIPSRLDSSVPETYNIYPAHSLEKGVIASDINALVSFICQHQKVVIDGYIGVFWEDLIEQLSRICKSRNRKVLFSRVEAAMHEPEYINRMVAPYLGGDDPLFGKITDLELKDWFDPEKMMLLQPDEAYDIHILLGNGAALAGWEAPLIYVDIPKNELQFRMRAGYAHNLGVYSQQDNKQTYKRYYFVDWRVLDKHKCELLPRIDRIVDGQRPDRLLSMSGDALRTGLSEMAHTCFRPRPWFEPGAWGGNWMKERFEGLNKEVPNLAWSFELMVLENGLLFESDGYLLEVSFDSLMYTNYKDILGEDADRFRYDFPIRFDFLDTFDGGNLSVQCHPTNEYIRTQFGMPFTQDETYYILDCKETPEVYLGFREGVEPEKFRKALTESAEKGMPLNIEEYVCKLPAKKHDLFLIPNGTVHASGRNNLVLEISSAPYIFTFKMYDWLRLDLDGKPRPLNIEHGMKNLNFDRQGKRVQEELISRPEILENNENCTLEHLPTHPEHFYDVYRYSFKREIHVETHNKCHVWMIVDGHSVILRTEQGKEQRFHFAETFVVPAAARNYTLINEGPDEVKMVQSFVK